MQTKKSETVQNNVETLLPLFKNNFYVLNNSYSQASRFEKITTFTKNFKIQVKIKKIKSVLFFHKKSAADLLLRLCRYKLKKR